MRSVAGGGQLIARARPMLALSRSTRYSPNSRNFPASRLRFSSDAVSFVRFSPQRRQYSAFHTQLEESSSAAVLSSLQNAPKQTLTEKIVQRHAIGLPEGKYVQSGDYVTIYPHHCMTHDNSWPVAMKMMSIGATKIHDNRQIVMTLDHDVQNKSESNLKKYRQIEEFAKKHGVDFYPAGQGIGHQIMIQEGYAWPATMVVASDSHSNMYGGIGALGTAVVRTDAASIYCTGRTWWQIPPIAKITFTGTLPEGVTGKDVIVALCGLFNNDEVLNHAIEFTGSAETLRSIPIDDRLAIANMTTEWGALTGLFPIDSLLQGWLRFKATEAAMSSETEDPGSAIRFTHQRLEELFSNRLEADKGARYAKELYLNLSTLAPYVSGPNSVKLATPLTELAKENIKVDRCYLVSCTNSRASDLTSAAKVFKDAAKDNGGVIPKIANGVNLYIAAASQKEQEKAEATGDWQALLEAGAQPLPAGCGPCIGLGTGLLQPGEVGVSASNRNFKGRMGSTDAKAYLASPEVVAASALSGIISGPGRYKIPEGWNGVELGEGDGIKEEDRMLTIDEALDKVIGQLDSMVADGEKDFGIVENGQNESTDGDAQVSILPGFPSTISGEIVFVDADNLNTDQVYAGKWTYQDNVSREKMAEVCMENYDPEFSSIVKDGDILVSGFSFGCGSSREQAAVSILANNIPLVVAGSFSNIFARNSINNALMGLEIPQLVERLREAFPVSEMQQKGDVEEPNLNKESLDSPPPAPLKEAPKVLTRRTGWHLTWDVRRSKVEISEGEGKRKWSVKVGELPANVQEIIAKGGLEKWVKAQIEA